MILAYSGEAFLAIALILAGLQAFGSDRFFTSYRLAYGQLLFVAIAFVLLVYAHITDQFSLMSVVMHSHTNKPLLYKIAGAWGNHEGSMLLWVLILSAYGALLSRQVKNLESPFPLAAPLMGFMNFGFLLFVLMACDPFAITESVPLQGQDLNPILQDPSLAIHPPILYMGYAGFAVPFVMAVAALVQGDMPNSWPTYTRPWILFSWTFLTLGVGLGSYWAYYELGWGGWWFWDPVENVALMPWLLATALLHTVIAVKANKALSASTLLLSIGTFAFCLLGTFLVRSGLLTSVHNFAVDPERGAFIMILSSLLVLPALVLFIWRFSALRSTVPTIPLSRSGLIVLMTLILTTATATVALGTLYPLILDLFGQKMTVGAPYFNTTMVPLGVLLLILVGMGPWYTWPSEGLPPSSARWVLPIVTATLLFSLIACFGFGIRHILGLGAFSAAAWVVLATLGLAIKKRKIFSGTILAHLGIGIAVLGMVGSSLGEREVIQALKVGDALSVGPITLTLQKVVPEKGKNYNTYKATLLMKDGRELSPEKRFYWTQGVIHGESAIRSVGFGRLNHIYVTIGEEYEGDKWSIHAYYKPYINLLWLGILLIVLGGCVGIYKRIKALPKIVPLVLMILHPALSMDAHEQLIDQTLEARARALDRQIICPTCQGQTLEESPVEVAVQLRTTIRQALKAGQTDQQIMDYFVEKYGPQILTHPPVSWRTGVLWFAPWVILLASLGAFVRRITSRKAVP